VKKCATENRLDRDRPGSLTPETAEGTPHIQVARVSDFDPPELLP